MEIKYFPDSDTLLINFTNKGIAETRDLSENIVINLDKDGLNFASCLPEEQCSNIYLCVC